MAATIQTLSNRSSVKFAEVMHNNKRIITSVHGVETNPIFEFEDILQAGWIKITSIGNENLYFIFKDDDGDEQEGFCKCL